MTAADFDLIKSRDKEIQLERNILRGSGTCKEISCSSKDAGFEKMAGEQSVTQVRQGRSGSIGNIETRERIFVD